MAKKIGRNEPCWCNSGKKYKHCHLRRGSETPLPETAIHNISESYRGLKTCFHPHASESACSNEVCNAHSVQRSTLLKQIVDANNKVRKLCLSDKDASIVVAKAVGWKQASTFKGFCSTHDNSLFAPIEKVNFSATPEQCFLLVFRSFCHEYFLKQDNLPYVNALRGLLDRGNNDAEQLEIQRGITEYENSMQLGVIEHTEEKIRLDKEFTLKNYSAWSHWVIYTQGPISVVASSIIVATTDVNGNRLQYLEDHGTPFQDLYVNMVSIKDGKNAIVFSWRKGDIAPFQFLEPLLIVADRVLPDLILLVLFTRCENVFFSTRWWDNLGNAGRVYLRACHQMVSDIEWSQARPAQIATWTVEKTLPINFPA